MVSGFVHRIYRACSSWQAFHSSMEKAIKILEQNQYPSDFYNPIIKSTLNKIIDSEFCEHETDLNDTQSITCEEDQNYDPMCDMDEKDKSCFLCNIVENVLNTLRTICTKFMPLADSL